MNHVKLLLVSTNRADWGHVEPLFKKAQYDPRFKVDVLKVEEGQECQRASVIDDCDIVVFQGDRTELLYYAHRAIAGCKIIAHLAGGERTKGSTDDCVRDAMTKLAHLHYPVHQQAKQRLLELQEEE